MFADAVLMILFRFLTVQNDISTVYYIDRCLRSVGRANFWEPLGAYFGFCQSDLKVFWRHLRAAH